MMAGSVSAEVKLPAMVGDRMVLQRDTDLKIWGEADPGECVTVKFRGDVFDTAADKDGHWSVIMPPQSPGGPFVMEVNGRKLRDVLVGDVWLCSGQSNQETPISRLTDMFPEIEVSNNHMIRHYKVPTQRSTAGEMGNIAPGQGWYSATASDVMNWTALAYFFANEAYDRYKVPVGMLVSSLGGSAIESWISQEHLREFPDLLVDRAALDSLESARRDQGEGRWNVADLDDSSWPVMNMPGTWHENGLDVRGTVWMRKDFTVPQSMVGRHAVLYMGTLVDADEVFVNGVCVGRTAYQYPPRKYEVPAGVLREGKNVVAVRLTANNGRGEFVKDKPYYLAGAHGEKIDLTGAWRYKVGKDNDAERRLMDRVGNLDRAGSQLYNGMIYPLRDYKVKGAIWYQGETNAGNPAPYASYMSALVDNWRELWQMPSMPFLLVQLPNFMEKRDRPTDSGWARIREAQLKASRDIPGTALAVTYDSGVWNDIHPLDKKTVARRLFLGARALAYGEKNVAYTGPLYESMRVDGNRIILTFSHVGAGLTTADGKPLRHFAIAGEDGRFVWADAVIKGKNTVVVSSPDVKVPVAVRYAWSDNPEDANLRSRDGLLASPFRTDTDAAGSMRKVEITTSAQ